MVVFGAGKHSGALAIAGTKHITVEVSILTVGEFGLETALTLRRAFLLGAGTHDSS